MTVRAIGAAVVPPTLLWFWSTTAIATSGGDCASFPANAMNHVVLDSEMPVSAVHRLAADRVPGSLRSGSGRPSRTTRRIIASTSCAVRVLTAWRIAMP